MKKLKLLVFTSIPIATTLMLLISCTNSSVQDDKINPDDKIYDNDFLNKPVNEKWVNIDVKAKTFQEWIQIKQLYELEIINLQNQNNKLTKTNVNHQYQYYKNQLYIAWYLRIIGKANKNIDVLKFASFWPDIINNDDMDANFTYALYVEHWMPETFNLRTDSILRNYFFKNMVNYNIGDLLKIDTYFPQNYLNLEQSPISKEDIITYYSGHMLQKERTNINKVLDYFKYEKDKIIDSEITIKNREALTERWINNIWSPDPGISTESPYFRWTSAWKVGESGESEPDFKQLSWEKWIKS